MRLGEAKRAPKPFDRERGREARALFSGRFPPAFLDLIEGVAGSSTYLSASIHREKSWLAAISEAPIEQSFEALLLIEPTSFEGLSKALRIAKRRAALLIALADIGGLWVLEDVTSALTRLADKAVQTGLQFLVEAEAKRGKLPADPKEAAGMFVLAMGKMGAYELNYSSDIDLIVLFDETRHAPEDWGILRPVFIRITKRLIKLLSENTAEGYVFRTDLRLRPDASVTPVCIATEPAENYYESLGRTWERAAYIKARSCAGAVSAGEAFLQRLEPFIWRRYLDYAAVEDAHQMRLRIREHKGLHGPIRAGGHDLKLGMGGIREIEFFAQTQQIILGGKDRGLRMRGTIGALDALGEKGIVPKEDIKALVKVYRQHRRLEHRIQMLDDAQTHQIPEDKTKRLQLAMLSGYDSVDTFDATVVARLETVHNLIDRFFNDPADTNKNPLNISAHMARLIEGWPGYPALRTDRARHIFEHLKPQILEKLGAATNPDEALSQFDTFLRGLPAGVQVFSLFKANPDLLDMLVEICAMAPELARYLGQNPRVLEAVISPEFFKRMPDVSSLKKELASELAHCTDYEQKLDAVRVWAQEKRFRVGVHLLRGISLVDESSLAYSDIAEACVAALFDAVAENFSLRHGPQPGQGAAIIAMGKLGSREMTVSSDLDLIVVYDAEIDQSSKGPRPLTVPSYYARFTQALVSALTVATSKGGLYQVDMRLRPSGRQGPVATSLRAFETYQKKESWVWEHMALLRSRVVAGPIVAAVEKVVQDVLHAPQDSKKVLASFEDMRSRLAKDKPQASIWDIKNGAGGLMDIELFLQAGGLILGGQSGRRTQDLARNGWLTPENAHKVVHGLHLYHTLMQVSRLALKEGFDAKKAGAGTGQLLARSCGLPDVIALDKTIDETRAEMAGIIAKKLGDYP